MNVFRKKQQNTKLKLVKVKFYAIRLIGSMRRFLISTDAPLCVVSLYWETKLYCAHAHTHTHTHRMPGIIEPFPKACKKEKTVYIGEPFLNFSTLRSSLDSIAKPIIMVSLCVHQCRKPAPLAGMTLFFCLSFYGSQLLNRWRMYSQSRLKPFLQQKVASFWMVGRKKCEDSGGQKTKHNRTK